MVQREQELFNQHLQKLCSALKLTTVPRVRLKIGKAHYVEFPYIQPYRVALKKGSEEHEAAAEATHVAYHHALNKQKMTSPEGVHELFDALVQYKDTA